MHKYVAVCRDFIFHLPVYINSFFEHGLSRVQILFADQKILSGPQAAPDH